MHAHRRPVDGCFGCKLRSINFGIVPGAYQEGNSRSYYDSDALAAGNFPTAEEGKDLRSDALHALKDPGAAHEETVPVYVDGDGKPLFYP